MIRGDNHLVLDNARDDFPKLVQWVHEHGRPTSPHNVLTYELSHLTVTLLDPLDSFPLGVGLRSTPAPYALEALELLSGESDYLLRTRMGLPPFRRDLYGLAPQFAALPPLLYEDGQTRRAVCAVWDPRYDLRSPTPSKLLAVQLLWRDSELECSVIARSWDVIHDQLFAYAQLQLTMCSLFGTRPGPLHLHATSFHLNARDVAVLDYLHTSDVLTRPSEALPGGLGSNHATWADVVARSTFLRDVASGRITDGVNPNAFNSDERWYLEQLRPYWKPKS